MENKTKSKQYSSSRRARESREMAKITDIDEKSRAQQLKKAGIITFAVLGAGFLEFLIVYLFANS